MSLDLETLAEQTAAQIAGIAISKAVDKFTESQPAVAEKAQLAEKMLLQSLDLFTDEQLAAFLTSDAAAAAKIAYRLTRAAKFGQ